jgi:translation elongation factor EF-4
MMSSKQRRQATFEGRESFRTLSLFAERQKVHTLLIQTGGMRKRFTASTADSIGIQGGFLCFLCLTIFGTRIRREGHVAFLVCESRLLRDVLIKTSGEWV